MRLLCVCDAVQLCGLYIRASYTWNMAFVYLLALYQLRTLCNCKREVGGKQ